MVNPSRTKGTRAETAVVRWLQQHGWPDADRAPLRGAADTGDVTGIPSHVVSVKFRSTGKALTWSEWLTDLRQMQINRGAVDLARDGLTTYPAGVLVVRRSGYPDVGSWYATTTVADYFDLFGELLT